jgi:hypothetical protein
MYCDLETVTVPLHLFV